MSDNFLAEIRIFPFNFAPRGWAFCDGQLLPLSQNTALFSLVGTFYGGDGKSTFGLPDLQGSAAMQPGQGQGLSLRDLGQQGGTASVVLLQSEIPGHTHSAVAASGGGLTDPTNAAWGAGLKGHPPAYAPSSGNNSGMSPVALSVTGSSLPHNNLMPYLTLNFCIALQGIFPQRP